MSIEALWLKKLDDAQAEIAKEALIRPQGRDAFEYGRVAGIYAGLERAREFLVAIINDEDAKDREL